MSAKIINATSDGTHVRVRRDAGAKAVSLGKIKSGWASDPHACTGTWPLCQDFTLTLTASGLEFPGKLSADVDPKRSGHVSQIGAPGRPGQTSLTKGNEA